MHPRNLVRPLTRGRLLAVAALAGAILLLLAIDNARPGSKATSTDEYVVRQTFDSHNEQPDRGQQTIGDVYIRIGTTGEPVALVGKYYNPSGEVTQVRYVDADGERVYMGTHQRANENCVATIPPYDGMIEGVVLQPTTDEALVSWGFSPGGEPGDAGLALELPAPPLEPITSQTFEVADVASTWMRSETRDGWTAVDTVGLDADGLRLGYWTETTDPDGNVALTALSMYTSIETYDVSVFDWAMSEAGFDDYPAC